MILSIKIGTTLLFTKNTITDEPKYQVLHFLRSTREKSWDENIRCYGKYTLNFYHHMTAQAYMEGPRALTALMSAL